MRRIATLLFVLAVAGAAFVAASAGADDKKTYQAELFNAFGLVNGDNELPFSAVLKGYADQTANPLKAGAFTAVTNFTLSYE